jgi:O-antigen ligase
MHFGQGPLIQQSLMRARPWQRYAIGAAMIAGGILLLLIGHIGGGVLAAVGAFLLWRLVRSRLRRELEVQASDVENTLP